MAFTSVAPAVAFCMEVQYKLLDTAWPSACLKLAPCKPVHGAQGQLLMAVGERVVLLASRCFRGQQRRADCRWRRGGDLTTFCAWMPAASGKLEPVCCQEMALPLVVHMLPLPLRVRPQGPRVRMGVHWAAEGSVAHRLHQLTKQRIFEGPGLHVAQDVSAPRPPRPLAVLVASPARGLALPGSSTVGSSWPRCYAASWTHGVALSSHCVLPVCVCVCACA